MYRSPVPNRSTDHAITYLAPNRYVLSWSVVYSLHSGDSKGGSSRVANARDAEAFAVRWKLKGAEVPPQLLQELAGDQLATQAIAL